MIPLILLTIAVAACIGYADGPWLAAAAVSASIPMLLLLHSAYKEQLQKTRFLHAIQLMRQGMTVEDAKASARSAYPDVPWWKI